MTRRSVSDEEPGLFDFPLRPEQYSSTDEETRDTSPAPEQVSIDLADPNSLFPTLDETRRSGEAPQIRSDTASDQEPRPRAPLIGRLLAALFDLGLIILVGLFCILSSGFLGLQAKDLSWPPLALFLLSFSFLYHVIPLSFWGRTPGMAITGLTSRNANDLPLSIGQTGLRWLGTMLTLALIGLPAMLVFTGASLTDRISGSLTFAPPRVT